jgi:hypothetical protein
MDSNRWVNRTACKPPLQVAMRKAILMTLLAVVSSSAAAGWIEAVSDERSTIYVDPATIRSDGNLVRIGALYDLNTPVIKETNGKPYASQKVQSEFDCKEKLWRMLEYSWYTGKMGEGQMVENFAESYKLKPIRSGSAAEIMWKLACAKK